MARPLSDDKRNAILDAATEVVASFGVSAPTARIAKDAGVAEGTLFTYFANKDALLNALFVRLKAELRDATSAGYPSGKSLIDRCRYLWECYIGWGLAHPLKCKALRQLAVSDRITEESRKIGRASLGPIGDVMHECATTGALKGHPPAFTSAVMSALADTTMDFIAREPAHTNRYTKTGFEAFWRAAGQ